MLKVIEGFFTGPNGEGSSKRLMGIACLTAGIVYVFVSARADTQILVAFFTTGTALLTASAITKT
jgi:hypothetical protein